MFLTVEGSCTGRGRGQSLLSERCVLALYDIENSSMRLIGSIRRECLDHVIILAGGYLVRQRSKADGRSVSLRLTSKGKKVLGD
jgi:hypothetical protein